MRLRKVLTGWQIWLFAPLLLLLASRCSHSPSTDIPQVSITSPADGGIVSDTVTVRVSVTDNDGIGRVQIYIDNVLRQTITAAPFEFNWDCTFLRDGSGHTIRARATDVPGNSSEDTITVQALTSSTGSPAPRGMGFEPLAANVYNSFPVIPPPGIESRRASIDLAPLMPPVGDQGLHGSGVGWAAGYALKSYQEKAERDWSYSSFAHRFSPAYIYNQIKPQGSASMSASAQSDVCDQGCTLDTALNLLRSKGCASLATMPFNLHDCFLMPSDNANQEAAKYRIREWGRIDFTSRDVVKRFLAGGYPVIIGFRVYEDFFHLPPDSTWYRASGNFLGNHAACLVGYDDHKGGRGGAFKVLNSWGAGWSDNGFGWIDYAFFPDVCLEAYAVVDSIDQRPDTTTIRVTTNLLSAKFTVSRPGGPTYSDSGMSWCVYGAPAGAYTVHYSAVSGYSTPPDSTKTLATDGSIAFAGEYTCTGSLPLSAPARISPQSADVCLAARDTLIWSVVSDLSCGGPVTYDLYFGTANPPPKLDSLLTNPWYVVRNLSASTKYYWKIVAKGTQSRQAASSVWDFTTSCWTALPVPAGPHPANASTCQPATDTLTWSAVTDPCGGTVVYDVYFGAVNPPPLVSTGQSAASLIRTGLTPNTPYYWKVSVRGDCGRQTDGTVWNFTPACTTPLPKPVGPTPDSGATGQPATVTLVWNRIDDPCGKTVTYDVYIDTLGSTALPKVVSGLTQNSFVVGGLLSGKTYRWRVCASADCRSKVCGNEWTFRTSCTTPLAAPYQTFPVNGTTCDVSADTLRWISVVDPCGDTVKYDVYFGTTNPPPLLGVNVLGISYPVAGMLANTRYYWYVCAKGTGSRQTCGGTVWSLTTRCTTLLSSASAPIPSDGATNLPSTLALGWSAVTDPCGGTVTYDVYFDTVAAPRLVASGVTTNTYALSGLTDGNKYWKVRVNGTCDRHTDGTVWTFRVGCNTALPAPDEPDPSNGATAVATNPTLRWGAVIDPCGDTVKYDVYFGTSSPPPLVSSNVRNNWYALTGLPSSTKHYWKIVAKGTKTRQTPGPIWNFTTVCPALAAPAGPGPVDGITCNALSATLTWNAVTDPCGAVTYDLYVGDPLALKASDLTTNQYVLTGLDANTRYPWRVCAKGTDARMTCGPVWNLTTGCPKSLTALSLLSPANSAIARPTTDTLKWNAAVDSCGDTVKYDIYFGIAPSPPLVESNWKSSKYPVSGLIAYQKYYWKICARSAGGCVTCVPAVWNFTTGCPGLTPPSGPTPANGADNQLITLNLQWVRSVDTCGHEITYDVYLDTLTPPGMVTSGIVSNYYSAIGLRTNTTYYWKIVAQGTNGRATSSSIWNFKTHCPNLLASPTGPSPADSAACQTKPDTLRWNAITDPCGDAITYDVYFGTSTTPPKVDSGRTVNKYHPAGLNDTTKYYWKICVKGTRGRDSCGKLWSFTTKCPTPLNAPGNPVPADSAVSRPTTDTLRWDAVVDPCGKPVTYDVYFGTSANPPLVSQSQSTITHPVNGLLTNTNYYWKVCAKASGGCVACSEVWIFNTGCALPAPGHNVPSSDTTCQAVHTNLNWAHVSDPCGGPVTYDVYLDTASPPAQIIASHLNVNYITTGTLLENTQYHWKVCANGTSGRQTCSGQWDFWVGCNTPLPTPSSPSPANDTICNATVDSLMWATITEPCGDSVRYDVYFGTANPPPLVASNLKTRKHVLPTLTNNTKYYWQVCVKGLPGGCRQCGPVWNFTTICTKLFAKPAQLTPKNDSLCTSIDSIRSSWTGVSDTCGTAIKYDVLWGTDTLLTAIKADLDSTHVELKPLLENQVYYWRVRAKGTCGRETYSERFTFTTACIAPMPTAIITPVPDSGSIGAPVNDTLTWGAVVDPCGGTVTYDVYFGNTSPPPFATSQTTTAFIPPGMGAGTKYYWKIVARGKCGRTTVGHIWDFTTAP